MNSHLRIDKGVTLLGSQNLDDYPEIDTRVAGMEMKWPAALIKVTGAGNVINASSMPESVIENFHFKDCQFQARSAGRITQGKGWQFENVTLTTPDGKSTPTLTNCEDMKRYSPLASLSAWVVV